MIDFHAHILPDMDDGADSIKTSLEMMRASRIQGITCMFATPHFYAFDDNPELFLKRREKSYNTLMAVIAKYEPDTFPAVIPGAEILYFPGMGDSAELKGLAMGKTGTIMVEPPMQHWQESMIEEIVYMGNQLRLVPIIAHVDRYMRLLDDYTLIDRVLAEKMIVQVNASFFIHSSSQEYALKFLDTGKIHMLGSDCHNMSTREPNIEKAAEIIRLNGSAKNLARLSERCSRLVHST